MCEYRLYIDESGDHGYKHAKKLDNRYLGLTGVLIKKSVYDVMFQPQLEQLKQMYFSYDIDDPPILVRNWIIERRSEFGVLQDTDLNSKWEDTILNYFAGIINYSQVFTVVVDKDEHYRRYPKDPFDPYIYGFKVLLRRVRGYLAHWGWQADVMAESRGKKEDKKLKNAYCELRDFGDQYGQAQEYQEAFPQGNLMVKMKNQNIAGLQIADLLANGQALETLTNEKMPLPRQPTAFTKRLNSVVKPMVNQFGQYLLV